MSEGIMLTAPNQIAGARVLTLKAGLKLEVKGMTRSGRSCYAIIKEEFGFKGNKQKVFDQLQAWCDKNLLGK